ncbi:hypothetical protein BOX15_Mlig017381g2 [Macrostomum lignano]|uniref:non-specific serine/threonine protein kinase n=1 Tax=Macrostomum lignano TaxID=282301 RepID=A0A267H3F4_9PLAT|nr:hypothetical protein BOX15_Mlig017381g2 [Macrostomum lignano]
MVRNKHKQQQNNKKKQQHSRPALRKQNAQASVSPLQSRTNVNLPNRFNDSLFADPEDGRQKKDCKAKSHKLPNTSSMELHGSSSRSRLAEALGFAVTSGANLTTASPLPLPTRSLPQEDVVKVVANKANKVAKKQPEPQPTSADKVPDFSSIEKYSLVVESVHEPKSVSSESPAVTSRSDIKQPMSNNCHANNSGLLSASKFLPTALHFSTPMQQLQHVKQRRLSLACSREDSSSSTTHHQVSNIEYQSPLLLAAAAPGPHLAVAFRDKDSVKEVSRRCQPITARHCGSFYIRARKRASSRRRVEVFASDKSSSRDDDIDDDVNDKSDKLDRHAASLLSSATADQTSNCSSSTAAASASVEASMNATYWNLYTEGRHRDCVLRMCDQTAPLQWCKFMPADTAEAESEVKKLGEGVFGEVYSVASSDGQGRLAVKVLPIAGRRKINGEPQKSFDEVLPELLIARKLTALSSRYCRNRSSGFAQLLSASVHRGRLHRSLATAWQKFAANCATENNCPAELPASQLWLAMRLAFAGGPLETFSIDDGWQALGLAGQVAASLAAAEAQLQFEHRDLHWGNVLIQTATGSSASYLVAGRPVVIATRGIAATVIDFTISRLSPSPGCVMFTDLSDDEELFAGEGDYQFEIYRLMRSECNDNWRQFVPKTNVYWMHYLAMKMLEKLGDEADGLADLKRLTDRLLNYSSCQELVLCTGTDDPFAAVRVCN